MALPFVSRGRRSERRAARFIRRAGLRILGRNLRAGGAEIDLLAAEGPVLVVVEVRLRRAGFLAADLSVDAKKARNLRRCAASLVGRHGLPPTTPLRFDLVLLDGEGAITHLRDALPRVSKTRGPL